jgi:hypothetical protein
MKTYNKPTNAVFDVLEEKNLLVNSGQTGIENDISIETAGHHTVEHDFNETGYNDDWD